MTGATGNVYCGLHEFEDMAFVLHSLRPEDLFIDVGANVGSYTVLAAGVVGARCICFEPAPQAYRALLDNLRLNDLESRVDARNECVADVPGEASFTADLDTVNHVVADSEKPRQAIRVPVTTLDVALRGCAPTLLKIDVEGYESAVLAGAERTLRNASLQAVLMELNGSGARYGFGDRELHKHLLAEGFTTASYQPMSRTLRPWRWTESGVGNVLYVRDLEALQRRVRGAPRRTIHGSLV